MVLQENRFEIIIPDRLLNRPHSLDKDITVMDHVNRCINAGSNFVFETPFQFDTFVRTIDFAFAKGYHMSIYQLFVNSLQESALRVLDRYNNGGLHIASETVKDNFNANFKNVARFYFYFHASYFIENDTPGGSKLLAAFQKMKLQYYRPNNASYLQHLFNYSSSIGRMDDEAVKIIKATEDFNTHSFEPGRIKGFD